MNDELTFLTFFTIIRNMVSKVNGRKGSLILFKEKLTADHKYVSSVKKGDNMALWINDPDPDIRTKKYVGNLATGECWEDGDAIRTVQEERIELIEKAGEAGLHGFSLNV